jgi:hypothetical protein
VERFDALYDRLKPRVLQTTEELPRWLRTKKDYTVWQRNNLWVLHNALALGGRDQNVTLIALWNGRGGDGPGGTEDMVDQARERGAKVVILDTKSLFGV